MKLSAFLLIFSFLVAIYATLAEEKVADTTLLSKYKPALELLEHAFHISELTPEKIKEIELTKKNIRRLSMNLVVQEAILEQKRAEMTKAKRSWGWFFDVRSRELVDQIQIEINEQVREMEKTIDEINIQWKHLKPLYGVYSKMFLGELFGFIPLAVDIVKSVLQLVVIFDVLTLIIMGPIAFVFILFFFSLGITFIASIFSLVLFGASVYWVFYLPSIIIQYDPTVVEFLSVYVPFVGAFFVVSGWFFGLFRRRSANVYHHNSNPNQPAKMKTN